MNNTDMLTLQKHVLENVKYDTNLFKKELQKSINWLDKDEIEILKNWSLKKFGQQHQHIIQEVFNNIAA